MLTRYSARTMLGSALTLAILAVPGIASAQYGYPPSPAAPAPGYEPPGYESPAYMPPVAAPAPRRTTEGRSVAVERRITIDNQREVPLAQLSIVPADSSAPPQIVAHDVASGQRIATRVRGSGCTYEVSGIFADQSEVAPATVDLCRQHTLALVQ